ncbi:hypothetical protein V8E51_012566 [Hyaloscypha variabilis]|uniref:CBM1 domain-containing protein n=1 Tax=Hyaloscypha variabilis (strain UAMH 11265 / GT02V1 / F) TaxID=1149755 RepID=A0A2J6RUM9_HYAVF|nr:hypothetical protein L207DRAFT_580902 [Hyaloscypha variabilis F]
MLFSKLAIPSLLALTCSVASQVIITITSTLTVVPVTITPLSTSTSTVFVTVKGQPSSTKSTATATYTVTVTAQAPATTAAAVCPLAEGGSCGLWNPAPGGCRQCAANLTCRSVLWSSSRCETQAQTIYTITQTVYKS